MKKVIVFVVLASLIGLESNATIASAAQYKQRTEIHKKASTSTQVPTPVPVPAPTPVPVVAPIPALAPAVTPTQYYLAPEKWLEFLDGSTEIWRKNMANDNYSGLVSDKYSIDGVPAYRFELRKGDPLVCDGSRSDIENKAEPAAEEHTYKFSSLLPDGGDEDFALDPDSDDIIAQWHNTPDPGEEWTNPPLSLHVQGDGHYYICRSWDEDPITTSKKMRAEGKKEAHDLGHYEGDKGKWVEWTFQVKWGWLPEHNPTIRVYKNGIMVLEVKDKPNTTNDQKGVNMQFGLYKWEWGHPEVGQSILSRRVVYFNNVYII